MWGEQAYRDEQDRVKAGRINLDVTLLNDVLELGDDYNIIAGGDDFERNVLFIIVSGPELPIHREGDYVTKIPLDSVQKGVSSE